MNRNKRKYKVILIMAVVVSILSLPSNTIVPVEADVAKKHLNTVKTVDVETKVLSPTPESAFSVSSSAASGNYIWKYDVAAGGTDVVIPDTIGGKKIQTISTNVFSNKGLTSVYIPDGITEIKDNAFSNNSIKELRLPETLKTLGTNVFYNNKFETLVIPDSLETMGNSVFANCGIKNLKLPNNIKTIPATAFKENKLEELVIPDSVESIGTNAFQSNLQMSKVHLSENLLTIGDYAFQLGTIKELYIGGKVKTIGDNAFANNQLESIILPDSLMTIGRYAFSSNVLKSLEIPNSVTTLGVNAFALNAMDSLKIGSGITSIPESCFANNLFQKIDIPATVSQIDSNAFNINSLLSVDLPDTVTTLAIDAFGVQKINTGLTKKDSKNVKRMSQIYTANQLLQIREVTSSWGAFDSTTNEMILTKDLSKGMDIINYYYHIENSTISSDTALKIRLLFNAAYDYQVVFKDSDGTVLKTEYVERGQGATAPSEPTPPQNKVFSKWDSSFDTVTSELIVTAVYEVEKYDVSFENTDGTNFSSIKVEHDTLVSKPNNPIQIGYIFAGWYTETTFNNQWDFANDKVTKGLTLYAKWDIEKYTITYKGLESQTHTNKLEYTVETETFTLVAPTQREDYVFDGWFDGENSPVTSIEKGMTGNLVLTAKWSEVPKHTVAIDEEKQKILKVYKGGVNEINDTNSKRLSVNMTNKGSDIAADYDSLEWEVENIAGFEGKDAVCKIDETTGTIIGLKSGVAKVTVKLKTGYDPTNTETYDTVIIIVPGNVNKTGTLALLDSIVVMRKVVGIDTLENMASSQNKEYLKELSDMDGDGKLTMFDVACINRMLGLLEVPSN